MNYDRDNENCQLTADSQRKPASSALCSVTLVFSTIVLTMVKKGYGEVQVNVTETNEGEWLVSSTPRFI